MTEDIMVAFTSSKVFVSSSQLHRRRILDEMDIVGIIQGIWC
jgi:hypothetical protein